MHQLESDLLIGPANWIYNRKKECRFQIPLNLFKYLK
jgi:hypothetical protein